MRSLINLTMSLTLLGTSLITPIESTIAAPAPIFRTKVKEIQQTLPKGMIMRLPAYIPKRSAQSYLFLLPENNTLSIMLHSEPTGRTIGVCEQPSHCIVLKIYVYKRNSPEARELLKFRQEVNSEKIILKSGVRAIYYSATFEGEVSSRSVTWEQNGFIFEAFSQIFSRQEIINIAKSMAKEPPIKSAR